jgi:hypothetical protein
MPAMMALVGLVLSVPLLTGVGDRQLYASFPVRQAVIEHWNGQGWAARRVPPGLSGSSQLNAVAAIAGDDVWTVGWSGSLSDVITHSRALIEHWNGRRWTVVPSPSVGLPIAILRGLAAGSTDDVWAVGEQEGPSAGSERALIEHWNGRSWSVVPVPEPPGSSLAAVASVSRHDVWAVGTLYTGRKDLLPSCR